MGRTSSKRSRARSASPASEAVLEQQADGSWSEAATAAAPPAPDARATASAQSASADSILNAREIARLNKEIEKSREKTAKAIEAAHKAAARANQIHADAVNAMNADAQMVRCTNCGRAAFVEAQLLGFPLAACKLCIGQGAVGIALRLLR